MSSGYEVHYASGITDTKVEDALQALLDTFSTIQETDSRLSTPIINRDLVAVAVALKPDYIGPPEEQILAVGQSGQIDHPKPYETFALKAVSRAFEQQLRGLTTDTEPMNKLAWLPETAIYKASSASVKGLHVGFAGGWAHHGRLLAVSFAGSLSESLGLPVTPQDHQENFSELESATRLAWLNEGQDSGDNTPEHALAREQYRFIFGKIVPHP